MSSIITTIAVAVILGLVRLWWGVIQKRKKNDLIVKTNPDTDRGDADIADINRLQDKAGLHPKRG